MKGLIPALSLVTAISIGCAHAQQQRARWYMAHVGPDTCVPLTDVGEYGNRLYYGTGNIHTPEEFARYMASIGIKIRSKPSPHESIVVYEGELPNGATTEFVLFNDKRVCELVMSQLEK